MSIHLPLAIQRHSRLIVGLLCFQLLMGCTNTYRPTPSTLETPPTTTLIKARIETPTTPPLTPKPSTQSNPSIADCQPLPDDQQQPAANPQLVIASVMEGNRELFTVTGTGQHVSTTKLVSTELSEEHPAWSPDGHWIAFESGNGMRYDLYRVRPDGRDLTRLTNAPGAQNFAHWSPDSTRIAYLSVSQTTADVMIICADGKNVVSLTRHAALNDGRGAGEIHWLPDSKRIVFLDSQPDGTALVTMNLLTGEQNRRSFTGSKITFSPDSTRIAYVTIQDGQNEIYISKLDGSDIIRITNNTVEDLGPRWSPDGRYLAFISGGSNGRYILYLYEIEGGQLLALTDDGYISAETLKWSPDSRFLTHIGDNGDLVLRDVTAGTKTILPKLFVWDFDWAPQPK